MSGASAAPKPRPRRTVFPNDVRLWGSNAFFYLLHRFHFGGAPASRWLAFLWLLLAAVWATGVLPGRWWGTAAWLVVFAVQIVAGLRARRADYIRFTPGTVPPLNVTPLAPSEKLPVHATGLFGVEGKYRRYTWLPGFYRTFATGEHAVMCLVRERRRWGVLSSPPEETGMWYAFVGSDSLLALHWGRLAFGTVESPALAVTYRLTIPPDGRRKKMLKRDETLYLAFASQDDGQRIYADLAQHLPSTSAEDTSTPIAQR